MKRNDSIRDLQDSIKCTNIQLQKSQWDKKQKGPEKIFEEFKEIIAKNFPNMKKETVTWLGITDSSAQGEPKEEH